MELKQVRLKLVVGRAWDGGVAEALDMSTR